MTGPNQIFTARLCRAPLVYDAGIVSEICTQFADLPVEVRDLLATTAGCSPFLRDLMLREGDWLRQSLADVPEAVIDRLLVNLVAAAPGTLGDALRLTKRRVALFTALCDLGGVWALEEVTGTLTRLADLAVDLSVKTGVAEEIRRGRLPGATPDDIANAGGMLVLAMGKMGAGELNYSSDIDLVCLFDETRYKGVEHEARASFVRVTRRMTALLSDLTASGYVFRTDLRLRPDAAVTPVCMSMAAAESYYEGVGRTWERAAYIKARPCAGDLAAGERFLKTLVPFVWRKHLDFAAIQDAHDMRLRIREHRQLNRALAVEGHDLKLGQGGIREIEFFTQTRQLISGGRDASLRNPTTVGGLRALAAQCWISKDVCEELVMLYRAHREVEHRLQMVHDAQTHVLPNTVEDVARIAAFCGEEDTVFRAGLLDRLLRTDRLTESFFTPDVTDEAIPDLSPTAQSIVEGWSAYPALRSDRAQQIFRRLRPVFLGRLNRATNPDEALMSLDGFLRGLPAGVQLFSLFEANPALIDLIIDIAATSPSLARYLSRNASVLDGVIGGSFFAPWPGVAALTVDGSARMADAKDYEAKLDSARRWMKEWHFRVGVHHLRGLIDGSEAGKMYADLAEAVIAALWPVVVAEMSRKHGPLPGQGAVVLGMGSLGAARLNAGSDLDLIVIYDGAGVEESDGPRPLALRSYYARLTQALVTALTVPMAEGKLYDIDMRLRPSGRQGPVATALESFRSYHETEAWTWEHLAMTRARPLAGQMSLRVKIENFRRELMATKGQGPAVRADVASMRARLQVAKPAKGSWDAKNGSGRLMDIELMAETLALMTASPTCGVEAQLRAGRKAAILSDYDQSVLTEAYRLFWRVHAATRLITEDVVDPTTLGEGARAFILRETGSADVDTLTKALDAAAVQTAVVIAAQLGGGTDGEMYDAD
ncbi:MAG: glutamine-synthetase adenylyltransferase [Rhodobacteraceae bacterium]|nr:glutamine-synthetase adenylyltransferase [Paracoccaceae bacterium]